MTVAVTKFRESQTIAVIGPSICKYLVINLGPGPIDEYQPSFGAFSGAGSEKLNLGCWIPFYKRDRDNFHWLIYKRYPPVQRRPSIFF